MVSGPVPDPILNMDNEEIIQRHCFSLIMSMFQMYAIPAQEGEVSANVFESLGMLRDFRDGDAEGFSYFGLKAWLNSESQQVEEALNEVVHSANH